MPIRAEACKLYPPNWSEISRRIRFERAGNRCEQCRAPNRQLIARATDRYMLEDGQVFSDIDGAAMGYERGSEFPALRFVHVVLTCAHLDHNPTNNVEANLKALCQQCHLRHDRHEHARNAAVTRRRKREEQSGQRRLF